MRLEPVALPVDGPGADGRQSGDDGPKAARLPRWTRQEILVLIQGKRVAESRVSKNRAGSGYKLGQIEPKWNMVSTYCKKHGMNRGPVQCRKRWSNLSGDYRKIKEWETKINDETESFWVMRNDLRKERKLPGFFDKEVYDMLDGGGDGDADADADGEDEDVAGLDLALATAATMVDEGRVETETEAEVLFDSGRSAGVDDGLFSDFEQESGGGSGSYSHSHRKEAPVKHIPSPIPISVAEKQYPSFQQEPSQQGTNHTKKHPASQAATPKVPSGEEGRKRKRSNGGVLDDIDGDEEDGATNTTNHHTFLERRLIEALENNGRLLSSQLEAHNTHIELDREQRKEQADSLISVLNKLADAMGRIADKL